MPPKKQAKPKFRKGRVSASKKGKKKASQKQIVNVTVTSTGSGSGGSSMGLPNAPPVFLPSTYHQPIFTPAVDPIKNTLTEVLKDPVKKNTVGKSQGSQVDFADEIPAKTPVKGFGFEDVYGTNPMHRVRDESGYFSAPDSTRPVRSSQENPLRMGSGAQVNLNQKPGESDADYNKRMDRNRVAREKRQKNK